VAVWSIIKTSELEGALRADAEYYRPEYKENEKIIIACGYPVELLDTLIRKPVNGFDYRSFSNVGIPYIRVGNMLSGEVLYREAERIQISADEVKKDIKLQVGDILFSRKGTFGRVAVVEEDFSSAVISSEIMRLRIKSEKVNPYYLSTFLNSKFGFYQVERRTHGVSNYSITQEDLLRVKVPILPTKFQMRVAELVKNAYLEHEKSYQFYLQAEQMVLTELGLDNVDLSQPNYYSISLTQAQKVSRVDAEYFQPKYDKLIEHLKKTGKTKLLGEITSYIKRGVQPTYVKDGEIIVINSQHLGRYLLNIEATERTDYTFWETNRRSRLQRGDVLVYSTGAYVGRTNVWFEDRRGIASNHVTIIRPKEVCNSFYLAVYLNASPGLLQAEKCATGSGQREIYPDAITDFLVYLPSEEFQTEIAKLVIRSYEARKKAKALLEKAKQKVEEMIG